MEALFIILMTLGLRPSEALGLRWEDIDLERRELRSEFALQNSNGAWTRSEHKTERSRRTLPMPDLVMGALKDHRRRRIRERLSLGAGWRDESDLVFTWADGSPHSELKQSVATSDDSAPGRRCH